MTTNLSDLLNGIYSQLVRLLNFFRSNRKLNAILNGLFLIIIIAVLGRYLYTEWDSIKNLKIQFMILPLLISLLLYGVNYVLFMLGWHYILKSFAIDSTFVTNSYIYSHSQIAKILPTPVWFIGGRIIMYDKEGIRKKAVLTSIGVEILFHIIIGLILLALTNIRVDKPATLLYLLSLLPLILLFIKPKILNFPFLAMDGNSITRKYLLIIVMAFLIIWVLSGPFMELVFAGGGIRKQITYLELWQMWIISSIIANFGSILLGGIGILREFSLTFLLSNFIALPYAVLIAAIIKIIMIIGNVLWPLLTIAIVTITKRNDIIETDIEQVNVERKLPPGDFPWI